MSASWACLGEANELMYSLDDPITFQFSHAAYFEIESGLSKNTLHPIGVFDLAFFARVIIRLFSDHNSLRSVKAGHQVREYSWPNELYYSNSYEAHQLIMAKWLPDYRASI
jgi:hypothetical protein